MPEATDPEAECACATNAATATPAASTAIATPRRLRPRDRLDLFLKPTLFCT
jgi:hypothetical protein